jgi:hypothetical protein
MLFSARLWRSFLLVFGIPVVLLGIVVSFVSGVGDGTTVILGGVGLFGLLWAVVGAVIDVTGGFTASYLLTNMGVHFRLGKGARSAADAAVLVGTLARSAGGAGAGLLARSEQDAFIAWIDVRKVTVSERDRYIQVRAGLGSKPVGIYCNHENFPQVRDLLHAKTGVTARWS